MESRKKNFVFTHVSVVLERDALLRLGDRDTDQIPVVEVRHDGEVSILYVLCENVGAGAAQGQMASVEREEVPPVGDCPPLAEGWHEILHVQSRSKLKDLYFNT